MQFANFATTLPLPWPLAMPPVRRCEYEVAAQLVPTSAVREEAASFSRTLASDPAPAVESPQRIVLLHSLVALEIEFLRAAGEEVPSWLLNTLDETEWASAAG